VIVGLSPPEAGGVDVGTSGVGAGVVTIGVGVSVKPSTGSAALTLLFQPVNVKANTPTIKRQLKSKTRFILVPFFRL
jgi:hypothetical protein